MNPMKWILTLSIIFMCFPASAQQREYKSGVNQVRLYNAPKPETPEMAKSLEPEKDPAEMDAADRVWEHYKALAMGQAEEKASEDKTIEKPEVTAPAAPEAPTAPQMAAEKPQKTGIASMIENYQKNKESRKDMRSMSFNTPKAASETNSQ